MAAKDNHVRLIKDSAGECDEVVAAFQCRAISWEAMVANSETNMGEQRKVAKLKSAASLIGNLLAWGWPILAGGGGLGLIITEGPRPLTHGWFAMFSGIALCPATAWGLRRYMGIEVSFVARLAIAAILIAAGRLALIFGTWPIGPLPGASP